MVCDRLAHSDVEMFHGHSYTLLQGIAAPVGLFGELLKPFLYHFPHLCLREFCLGVP